MTSWPRTGCGPRCPAETLPAVAIAAPSTIGTSSLGLLAGRRLRVRVVNARIGRGEVALTPPEWLALADDWNRLAAGVPFRRFEWFEAWWRHYGRPGWELLLLVVEDEFGRLVGVAPFYRAGGVVRGRMVRMLGSGEVCSEYQTILAVKGRELEVAAAIADWFDAPSAGEWDQLLLSAVTEFDPAVSALAAEFSRREYVVHQRRGMCCWRTALAADWDQFLRGLSSSRRARVRQLTRKYFDTGRVAVRSASEKQSLADGFQILVDLHQRRRRSLQQAGCFASPQFAGFHAEICGKFYAAGVLRLLWTELDGRPVAAEYAFTGEKTVYYYQTGLDPAACGADPGWLGMIGSLSRAIDENHRWFDFLRGEEPYKASWGAAPQMTMETRIVARHGLARLRHAAWLNREQLRAWARRGWHGDDIAGTQN